MGIDYTLIASILLYAVVVRLFNDYDIGIIFSAFAAVLGPFVLKSFLKLMILTGYNLPLSNLVNGAILLTVILQILAACSIFYELRKNENSMGSWFMWAFGGGFVLFIAIPAVVGIVVRA
jgi:hypothetical protein